jgi:hypothetical protein
LTVQQIIEAIKEFPFSEQEEVLRAVQTNLAAKSAPTIRYIF